MKPQTDLLLSFLLFGLEVLTRRDMGLILAGYRETATGGDLDRALSRMCQHRYLAKHGRGAAAQYTITPQGKHQLVRTDPYQSWNQAWDGKWRAFVYDVPNRRDKDRVNLWRALRSARLGWLQRSVWIWPHPIEPVLRRVLRGRAIPQRFCGFEADRVILCRARHLVESAWDFESIRQEHENYLAQDDFRAAAVVRTDGGPELAALVREEYDAYAGAFESDPFLPRDLWPRRYQGERVERRHQAFQVAVRRQARVMTG